MTGKGKKGKNLNGDIIKVLGLIGFLFMYAIMTAYILPLNSEILIHNWGIGVIGIIIFVVLYLIRIEMFWFRPKKLYFLMISVSVCFIIGDWADFILFLKGG